MLGKEEEGMRHADQIYAESIYCMKNILEIDAVSKYSGIGNNDIENVGDTEEQGRERGSDNTDSLHYKKVENVLFSYFKSQASEEGKRESPENYIRKDNEENNRSEKRKEGDEVRNEKREFRSLADIEFYQTTSQARGNCGKKIQFDLIYLIYLLSQSAKSAETESIF